MRPAMPIADEPSIFVPGRIEVLGKHTDYAGGASITCATTRGFRIVGRASAGHGVRVRSADGRLDATLDIGPDVHAPGWLNYVATVVRRVERNAPGVLGPCDLVFDSDLEPAAGMSSSSAFLIAVFLGLDEACEGRIRAAIGDTVHSLPALAEYLACVENGASYGRLAGERGVGTAGGSQDHTAILCSGAGRLRRFRYAPYAEEGSWPLFPGLSFVVAASGVEAVKTGAAMEAYNRASRLAREAAAAWSRAAGLPARHLADVLAADPDAAHTVARSGVAGAEELARRVGAFAAEMACVDAASSALAAGDTAAFAEAARESQGVAERMLGNQVPETIRLAGTAERYGALCASAFGAGFGGSVWALVPAVDVSRFVDAWRADHAAAHPAAAARARFVTEAPGPGATGTGGVAAW